MSFILAEIAEVYLALIPLLLIAIIFVRDRRLPWVIAFVLLVALEIIVVQLPIMLGITPEVLNWNWIGRSLSVLWVLLFLRFGPLSNEELGLTLRQRPGSIKPALLISVSLLAVVGFGVAFSNGGSGGSPLQLLEMYVYQAILDAIAEELVYRGVFISILLVALGGSLQQDEFSWNRTTVFVILIIGIVAAMPHALVLDDGVQFNSSLFFGIFVARAVLAWLRLYTGSLVIPIGFNVASNTMAFTITRLI